jgi:hypothetical protein
MPVRREDPLGDLKKEITALWGVTREAMLQGISSISGYQDSETFKKAMLKLLAQNPDFDLALKKIHEKHNLFPDTVKEQKKNPRAHKKIKNQVFKPWEKGGPRSGGVKKAGGSKK